MSPSYRIEIIAEGQHHLGHTTGNPDKDADNLLKMFLPALEKHGHKITFAAFHHGETTDILVGKPDQIRPAPAATESPVLSEIHANVASLVGKVDGLTKLVKSATKPAPDLKPPQPQAPKKIQGAAQDQEGVANGDKASQSSPQEDAPPPSPEKTEGGEA